MQGPHQKNFCDCGLYVTAIVDAFMQDPTGSSESIRVRRRRACPVYSPCLTCIALQKSKKDWWGSREPTDLRETFRKRTVELSEEWRAKRGCAAKEVTAAASKGEAGSAEGPEAEAGKGKGKEDAKDKEVMVVFDESDDEPIIMDDISHVRPKPQPRPKNKGKKGEGGGSTIGKAMRVRG